jgi:hypothetical protein
MKSIKYFSICIFALFTLGCGGNGGLDDGQQGPLKTIPEEVVLQSNTDACPPSPGVTVFAFGGTPPYTLRNPVSDYLSIDRTRIDGAGQGVLLTFLGGCLEKIPLIFVDRTGATATVDINYRAKISP